ncbi:hypothetical protein A3B84_01405 [Candidatus Nomurabacteria bacterium RIFCSPHIGHO2_02_FULL_35_13]|uniref:Uncharacterized protein n=1 Tax=Candidatus Nomurabacteria bacterium RIFCSPHIGHO2_02_FULL_35_13 TaxID=1801748 RepID=A0A1F6VNB6_9BACT|nr:MAG: hypothetical protein A3B84_01405 [Candidatus Nomurabacteria bacterium RIFCSPHIGHO2_02_FULL_35_13]
MNTKNISTYIITFGILISSLIFGVTLADTITNVDDANIQYPIAELGNCQNKNACKTYCDKSANTSSCIAFAEKNNLMTANEINNAKKFINTGTKGPGECTTKNSCEAYCDDISHIDECIAYAEKTGILPPQELEEAKQVQSAIAKGVKPPSCKNKKECDIFCDNPDNMNVCIAFGEAAGFLKGKDLEDAKKMISAIEKGAIPPPCKGKEACDAYCSQPDNMEVCMTFAQAAGFMSPKEAEESQKVLSAIKKGIKPPACKGKEECDKYCTEDSHVEECIAFSVAAGFMSEKDAEMARKTGGKGPGGCSGKEECDAFCQNPENQETCFNFGKENGLISPEQLKEMEGENNKFQPGPNTINPGGQMMSPQAGPGGCKTLEECKTYCQNNSEACKNFQPAPNIQQGQIQPIMPQGGRILPQDFNPNPQPGTVPQTEPGSFNPPPSPTSALMQSIANVLFSL